MNVKRCCLVLSLLTFTCIAQNEYEQANNNQVMTDIRQLLTAQFGVNDTDRVSGMPAASQQLMRRMMGRFKDQQEQPRAHPLKWPSRKVPNEAVRTVQVPTSQLPLRTQQLLAQSNHNVDKMENRKLFFGDTDTCYTDSCEFFLLCWLTGGLIQKSCGGFLFACCHRPGVSPAPATPYVDSLEHPSIQYGPVRSDSQCGATSADQRQQAQRRIVGGEEAGFGTFPWQAYVRIGSSRCGGSMLNNYYVVTAGHCVARARAEQVKITLGEYSLNSDVEPLTPVKVGVAEIFIHPYFKFTPQADRYDVAVLRLDRYVPYEPHISPICLPEKDQDFLGEYAWAAGWGAMAAGSRIRPKTLQVVDVPIIDNRQCEDWHASKGINVIIYDEMMCAGYRFGGRDSCQGDSGGPLMLQENGRWELIGIVSAGYSCAKPGQPGIYHRVSYTTDWISHIAFA